MPHGSARPGAPPYRLYHLGVGLANLLLAALALPVFLRTGAPLLRVFAGPWF